MRSSSSSPHPSSSNNNELPYNFNVDGAAVRDFQDENKYRIGL
jgi:hypothetical protein